MSLVLDRLEKRYGPIRALDGISLEVRRGQIFGFLGANGAGKTTAMRIVLDIIRPDGGTVTWAGRNNLELPRRTWGYLPEERGLYPKMRVLDQLVFFAGLNGLSDRESARAARAWLGRFRIPDAADRRAEELSKGNQQKVQFIASILHDPEVLLMDEPFTGLDPVNVALVKAALIELRDAGKTIVLSTHQMEMVEELCEAVAIIDRGRIIIDGPVRDVRRSTGRRVVRLAVEGDGALPWLDELDDVRSVRRGADYAELEVIDGRDPERILAAALDRGGRVTRFEIADPSLERIFIELVGRPPDEDETLAGATKAADTAEPADAGPVRR